MKNKRIIIISLIINIILIGFICSFININGDIIRKKQIVKEMSSSNKETELNTQLTDANKSATEYANYVQTCKTLLASTISDEGIETSENDTFEKMITNIGDIFTQRTKLDESVAAVAEDIVEGKIAYVNGEKIVGIGKNKLEKIIIANYEHLGNTDPIYQTIDVKSKYEDYTSLTNNNFALVISGLWNKASVSSGDSIYPRLSYNSTTGIVTIGPMRSEGGNVVCSFYSVYLYI